MAHATSEPALVAELADWILSIPDKLPSDITEMTTRVTLDTVACAVGGGENEASEGMLRAIHAVGGVPECTLITQSERSSAPNAVLYNGTLIRVLDCNDALLASGSGGHPSDNIAVALAFAEREHSSGMAFLRAVAVGYELFWRLERLLAMAPGYRWDPVSPSGFIGAAMAGLLMRLDRRQLANALAIGGAQTFTVGQVRRGEVSFLKNTSNVMPAFTGAFAAIQARKGMSGPMQVFEGERGIFAALGIEDHAEARRRLLAPGIDTCLKATSLKLYPATVTSQGAIAAAVELGREHRLDAAEIGRVEVRFPDVAMTRNHVADAARRDPRNRETADHSTWFLVAAALEDGELGPAQFLDDRWLRPSTREIMARTTLTIDARLNEYAGRSVPAVVTVHTRNGRALRRDALRVPGSPDRPLSDDDLAQKLRTFGSGVFSPARLQKIHEGIVGLDQEEDMASVVALLAAE